MLPLISGSAIAATLLILIHFFGLRLRQKLDFSHIQFLTALISKTQSVRRINNYLLLLLRLVFVASALGAFLLFLFQTKNNSAVLPDKVSVVMDTSWSMQSASLEKERSKVEIAFDAASDILKGASNNSKNPEKRNSGADTVNTPEGQTTFTSPQGLIDELGNTSRSTTTYLLSDFQKSTYSPEVLKSLPKEQSITLVSLANDEVPNIYIDSVWLEQPILLPNALAGISVRLASSLLKESSQIKVSASEGDKLLGATQVLLDPAQKAIAHFKIQLNSNAEKQITFSVEDPATSFDNQYFIILPKPSSVHIKVSRTQGGNDPIVQAYKAEPAFNFSQSSAGNPGLWIIDIPANGGTSALAASIKSWVNDGGSVLLIPDGQAQQSTVSFLANLGLQGVSEESKEIGAKALRQPDMSDAFFRQIFEKEVKNMKMPEAKPVLRWQSSFHTILKFTDNAPFLSTFRVGNGNVHLFAAPITTASSIVAHPLFVPVLYQLALSTNASRIVLSHQPNNGNITVPLEQELASKQPYALSIGGQTFIPDQRVRQNQLFLTLPKDLGQPGFYNVLRDGKTISSIALNIPRAESRLEAYTVDELKEILADHGGSIQVLEPKERVSLQKQLQKETGGPSLWKYCLILCFLCLVVEAIILSTKKSGSVI
ncbi:BatA domain-containing protein [Rufibacter aurantiacus]|uniref:BatA domain-containing protein n=1 Tax=Rufibacter aurantiacus TaxID=2817374 RepID=UPI001B309DAA|nr:BatA domain-containing protein [Rufibacter aurantiacus]